MTQGFFQGFVALLALPEGGRMGPFEAVGGAAPLTGFIDVAFLQPRVASSGKAPGGKSGPNSPTRSCRDNGGRKKGTTETRRARSLTEKKELES